MGTTDRRCSHDTAVLPDSQGNLSDFRNYFVEEFGKDRRYDMVCEKCRLCAFKSSLRHLQELDPGEFRTALKRTTKTPRPPRSVFGCTEGVKFHAAVTSALPNKPEAPSCSWCLCGAFFFTSNIPSLAEEPANISKGAESQRLSIYAQIELSKVWYYNANNQVSFAFLTRMTWISSVKVLLILISLCTSSCSFNSASASL